MSPPTKAPEAPDLDRQTERAATETTAVTPQRAPAMAPPQAAVLRGQQTAGNRAMAEALGAPRGIQRAPNDDDPRRTSGMAHGPTLDSSGGVATAGTLPGTQPDPRRTSGMAHGPTLDSAGGVATAGTLPGTQPTDPRRSGMAYGPTIDSAGGAATGPTLSGSTGAGAPAPGTPGPAAPGPPAPGPGPGPAPGGGGPGGPPGPIRPDDHDDAQVSESGALPQRPAGRRGPTQAVGYTDNSIASAYQRNPALVHRAINWTWYDYMLDQQKFTGDYMPRGIKVGNAVVVAPDYDGPGPPARTTPIEEPDPDRVLGPNDPVPGDPRLAQGPRQQKPDLSDPNAKRAIFPGSRRGDEPGMKPAVPLTHDEVIRAYRQNPGSVHASETDDWHSQVFAIDRGQGPAPRAYRSGNTIIVDPSYPLDGRPPDASPRGTVKEPGPGWDLGTVLNPVKIPTDPKEKARILRDPVEGPKLKQAIDAQNERDLATHMSDAKKATAALADAKKAAAPAAPTPAAPTPAAPDPTKAAQTISPTGYVPQEKKRAKWDVKQGEISRETAQEEVRTTDQGSDTRIKSSKKSLSLAKGAGQESKQREESQSGDKFKATERSTKVSASLGGLAINKGSAKETGTTPDAPKARSERNVGGTIGPEGVGGTASTAYTAPSGTKAEAKGDLKIGPDGSIELTGTGSITTPGGFTGHLSVSGKHSAVASDPKALPNGKFAVQFVETDESGAEIGGGWSKPGGGMSAGLTMGSSTANKQYETRVFDNKPEAIAFQLMAAAYVGSASDDAKKAATVEGALALKEGEVRGTSQTDTDTIGGSAGMSQVSVSVGSTDATTTGLQIEKREGNKVRVTPSIAEQKAFNASISVGGQFGNTKGSSETSSFSVTYEFDLGTDDGKKAFLAYQKQRLPPPMPPGAKWIDNTTGHAIEDHDVYKFAHIGEIGWGTYATQQTVEDESGKHTTAVGGQSETVELNAIRKLTFDKNRHARADIIGRMDNGQISQISAQMTVGGEDGQFNRDQFRKIFSDKGAPSGAEVTNSGEWTLTADIDKKVFEDFEKNNEKARQAKTREERLKIYSEVVQKNGAQMLGGQVRSSGRKLSWNLELKGDPNFPGAAGRLLLNQQRARLAAQLKEKPESAGSIAAEAKDTLGALQKRYRDVTDKNKYTDLPDELRDEQRDMINTHIAEFKSLRSQALSVQMRGGRKEDLTVVLKRAANEHGYDDVDMKDRAWRNAQDLVTIHETELSLLEVEVVGTRNVVQQMFGGMKDIRWGKGVHQKVFQEHNQNVKQKYEVFKSLAPRLTDAVGKMRDQKEKWSAQPDPKARENLLREYDAYVLAAIQVMDQQVQALRDAAREGYVVTSEGVVATADAKKLWEKLQVDALARTNAVAGLGEDGRPVE